MPPAYGPLEERPLVRENGSRAKGSSVGNGAGAANGAGAKGAGADNSNGRASTSGVVRSRPRAQRRGRDSLRRRLEKLRADVLKSRVKAEPQRRIPTWADWTPNGREDAPAPAPASASAGASAGAASAAVVSPGVASPEVKSPAVVSPAPGGAERVLVAPDISPGESTRVVTHLDVYSVAKVSIVFYLILLVVFVVASILLWLVADAFGAVDSIQRSIRSLFDVKSYVLHPVTIALYTSAFGAVVAVAGTIANVLAAVIYNLISEVVGGIRIGVAAAEDAGIPAVAPRRGRGRHEPTGKGDPLKRV